ncbi:MAG: nucleotidyltransferase family protein [Gammaproteobacteria bacterium]|nr:nucleotidyltransferase family protein [Gammaproteobacteria bacterium]MBQ0839749.1 nucleotidyltransferase family protein [Gammaproteobacteria bacterium]
MKAIVLAGGFGTRLRERVPDLPKPMAPVAGRPFLEYVLDKLVLGGVSEIILSVGYKANIIIEHFGDVYRNVAVSYAVEEEPLGTGGAIFHALKGQGEEATLVLNGDTFLDVDYRELILWYAQSPTQVAMVLREVPDVARYGSVLVSGEQVSSFVEKGKAGSGLINAGVYFINPGVFGTYSLSGKFELEADLLQRHCRTLTPRAFISDTFFIDIGVPDDYDRAQHELPALLR